MTLTKLSSNTVAVARGGRPRHALPPELEAWRGGAVGSLCVMCRTTCVSSSPDQAIALGQHEPRS